MAYTTVEVRCPNCEQATKIPVHHVRLNRCTNRKGRDYYSWRCPNCDTPVAKPADLHIVALLTAAGVASLLYALPLELDDPQRKGAAPLTIDDALDFTLALQAWDGEIKCP